MAKKFLKTLTNNIGFKLLAVVFAFVLWLVVYNIDDPVKAKSYTANVTIENSSVITDMNKYYEVVDGSNRVTFSISAKRTILDKLEDSDFTAVADMSTLVMEDDGMHGTVELKITSSRYENSIKYNGKEKYLRVSLENLMTKQFVISPNTKGKVADGYALGDVIISGSNILKVSGPESVVSQISGAMATIDVSGVATSVSDNVIPTLYDAQGNEIDTTKLTMNISTVAIDAAVLGTKDIPVVFETTGTPAEDYTVAEITADVDTIKVKGYASALNEITSLNVPAELLDISGMSDSLTTTIDISEYLPTGVTLVDNGDAVVEVTVVIAKYETEVFNVSTSRIKVEGLSDNYTLEFGESTIPVTIGGTADQLASLSASAINLKLDASGLTTGTHTVHLTLADADTGYKLASGTAEVTVKKTSSSGNNSNNSTNSGSGENTGDSDSQDTPASAEVEPEDGAQNTDGTGDTSTGTSTNTNKNNN